MKILSCSEADTVAAAKELLPKLRKGSLVYLHGDLGMGKSVFARALLRCLCQDEDMDVPSPTFTLVQMYDAPDTTAYHFDLYRIEDPEEIFELGWEDARANGITIVEWPQRLGEYMVRPHFDVTLSHSDEGENAREIEVIEYE
ncbi:MAG: tRNA (adenosine(37)-N6)-threonylcarbamoyltransferase complex ATPase subunit type 1 TsaE [Micavibrio sp. TMED27]|nr:tRNA (adenosine(37)-N6)-threonylcarbamoyltransferase complex ATPase subunit type 1 TsaE [Micavibrio sp.]OUT91481.1 MAG: tRNA (adenosine(37)-N6)-threonylcarbamoyltransferase complex ATPase subunit type 1 TsaE [Micavibrio sp. TMED27]|tara:strand:- start:667 stop:1095 length:429 start_codon:yes stop_codon:yes gene_type:complete